MPNQWTINASGVNGGSNKSALVGCHIKQNATNYQFQASNGTVVSTTTGTTLPTAPFQFPMFNSALSGQTALDWYITVDTLTGGASGNQPGGEWSNYAFASPEGVPSDTWVAQAGAGVEDDQDDQAAAASGSSK
ncbi:MAG TPA: hypothetical protein VKB02_06260 [Pyrinomonadaceae bacterium]|nr:hypothetical protein [Pyrinomonadaceae bacterium]